MAISKEEALVNLIKIRAKLKNLEITQYGFNGTIINLSNDTSELLLTIWEYVEECYLSENNENVNEDSLKDKLGQNIRVNLNIGDLPFHESFSDFIKVNKFKINQEIFYIDELSYFSRSDDPEPEVFDRYKSNLSIIKLLSEVADFKNTSMNELTLFFHKVDAGTSLTINYETTDLKKIPIEEVNELANDFENQVDKNQRKEIFKNELISFLFNKNTYPFLLDNWEKLIDNYQKSFNLYLSGFSFTKIITATDDHFHELSDKIQQTIGKVSNYIFAVPIAFIFLLRYFDFNGGNLFGDFLLLLIGLLFLILIWNVPFKNVSESIESILTDVIEFKNKVEGHASLTDVYKKLDEFEKDKIPSQRRKLLIAKLISVIIFIIVITAFLSIHFNTIKSLLSG